MLSFGKQPLLLVLLSSLLAAQTQQEDVLLVATHGKLNEVVRDALAADAKTLKDWSKNGPQDKQARKEFCPDYERKHLAGFYKALAESKSSTDDKAREARAQAAWMVYLLASFRPATKENLRQLLLEAKNGAPLSLGDADEKRGFATQEKIDKRLAVLEEPMPGRVRISEPTSECFLASKVHPKYPAEAKTQRIQGDAVIQIVVGKDGKLLQMTPISGPAILMHASLAGVQHWTYRPYHLTGQPVEFETTVTVKFTMMGGLGPQQWP